MFQRLRLTNFKSIASADISFRPLTVIVGPNASGKTSVLEALHLVSQFGWKLSTEISSKHFVPREMLSKGSKSQLSMAAEYDCMSGAGSRRIEGRPHLGGWRWRIVLPDGEFEYDESDENTIVSAMERMRASSFHPFIAGEPETVLVSLDASQLREPSSTEEPATELKDQGRGLAAVLAEIAATQPKRFFQLQSTLRAVVPGLDQVRMERSAVTVSGTNEDGTVWRRRPLGYRALFDFINAQSIDARSVSEGTIMTLGLLAVLFSSSGARTILLDDIEKGLHPRAVGELVTQLRRIQEAAPGLQIIATSHSPYLVDHLEPEEVRLSAIDADGHSVFANLTDHPDYERWKNQMAPGEFWSAVGEDWVVEHARQVAASE